jgi:hypothetical protein
MCCGVGAVASRVRRLADSEGVPPGGGILGGVYSVSML